MLALCSSPARICGSTRTVPRNQSRLAFSFDLPHHSHRRKLQTRSRQKETTQTLPLIDSVAKPPLLDGWDYGTLSVHRMVMTANGDMDYWTIAYHTRHRKHIRRHGPFLRCPNNQVEGGVVGFYCIVRPQAGQIRAPTLLHPGCVPFRSCPGFTYSESPSIPNQFPPASVQEDLN